MDDTTTRDGLKGKYDEYYGDDDLRQWREMGAAQKADRIEKLCSHLSDAHIIDVGAGEGAVAKELTHRNFGGSITCAEISESAVRALESRDLEMVNEIHLFDGYDLPVDDSEFDLAIATHVLEHVEHQRKFLRELSRVSEWVYIEVPLQDRVTMPADYQHNEVGHINFYNYKTFRRVLQTSGLRVEQQEVFDQSFEVMKQHYGALKGASFFILLRMGLALNGKIASNILPYHCGAVCHTHS